MKMYELLDSPEKWTQETASRNKDGTPSSTDPVCWCLLGACDYCYPGIQSINIRYKITERLRSEPHYISIAIWNDDPERTFEEVQQLLKELDI